MDKTETYIKMADCPEIQGIVHPPHTVSAAWKAGDYYAHDGGVVDIWDNEIQGNGIWLPRQDQLQEMVRGEKHCHLLAFEFAACFHGTTDPLYAQAGKDLGIDSDGSMEQMWLAFVMKTLHDKAWTGHHWA